MAEAPHDQNRIKGKLGVLCTDGVTLIPIAINPTGGGVKINTVDTISQTVSNISPRDNNYQAAWLAEDSVTGEPVPIYVDADGAILVDM